MMKNCISTSDNLFGTHLLPFQERDNMQKSEFLKALSDMWKDFDSRVLRYKVVTLLTYFADLIEKYLIQQLSEAEFVMHCRCFHLFVLNFGIWFCNQLSCQWF